MKKILIPSLIICSLSANEQNFIEIGGGFLKSKDNFSVESKKNLNSLNNAENKNSNFGHLSLFYTYDINEIFNIYTNIKGKGISLGSSMNTDIGKFGLGVKLAGSKAWENPFLTQTDRKKTDVYEAGFYTSYNFSINQNHQTSLGYEFSTVSYDKETLSDDLKREGERHIVTIENIFKTELYNQDLNYIANFLYEKYEADGKASSYDKYKIELGIEYALKKNISISLLSHFAQKEYDSFNTQVNKKIDVNIYGINANVIWDNPFNYENKYFKNTYLSFDTGYEEEKANDDFYDKENTYGMLSIGYRF
jgi:hypothetical protein